MSTNPLAQGDSLSMNYSRLFETEVRPSRAMSVINRTFFGAGLILFTPLTLLWLNGLLVLDEVGEFIGGPHLFFPLAVTTLVFLNALAALIGAGVYVSRNSTGLVTGAGGGRQSAAMPTGGQA